MCLSNAFSYFLGKTNGFITLGAELHEGLSPVRDDASPALNLYHREALRQVMAKCLDERLEADWSRWC
jgi:hypothetical protein